jgi:hypothetical protein
VGRIANPSYTKSASAVAAERVGRPTRDKQNRRNRHQPGAPAMALLTVPDPRQRDKGGTIVNLPSPTYVVSCPGPGINGAPLRNGRARRRDRPPGSVNVRSGRRACCSRAHSARRIAKWRFGLSKKRRLPPLFRRFSPWFFASFVLRARLWRKSGLEAQESRRVGLPVMTSMPKILAVDGFHRNKPLPIRYNLNLSRALLKARGPLACEIVTRYIGPIRLQPG